MDRAATAAAQEDHTADQDYYGAASADLSLTESDGSQNPEWAEYADEDGTPYWYNNYTGASQYENPWETY